MMIHQGVLVPIDDAAYQAWLDAGSPTVPPAQVDPLPEPLA